MMNSENQFRTKDGFCYIFPSKIVFSQTDNLTDSDVNPGKNKIFRVLLIYGIFAFFLLLFAYDFFIKKNYLMAFVPGLLGLYLVYGIISNINNSTISVIERDKIEKIMFKKGFGGITPIRFEIYFKNEKNKTQKRLIILPTIKTSQFNEHEKAFNILKSNNLI